MKFFIILFLLLSSCGVPTQYELLETEVIKNPLFIVIGGRTSCATDYESAVSSGVYQGYFKFEKWLNQEHITPNKILICITAVPQVLKYKNNEQKEKEVSLGRLLRVMKNKFISHRGVIFIVGYSHGGWISMKLASQLKAKINLFTIDPISIACSPNTIVYDRRCVQAPNDLNSKLINSNIVTWHNYYETDSYFLRSTPIDGAVNKQIKYENVLIRRTGHYWISREQQVWDDIQALLK